MSISRRSFIGSAVVSLVAVPAIARSVQHDIDPYEEMLAKHGLAVGFLVCVQYTRNGRLRTLRGYVQDIPHHWLGQPDSVIPADQYKWIRHDCASNTAVLVRFLENPYQYSEYPTLAKWKGPYFQYVAAKELIVLTMTV